MTRLANQKAPASSSQGECVCVCEGEPKAGIIISVFFGMNSGDGPQDLMHSSLVPAVTSPQLSGFAVKFPSSQRFPFITEIAAQLP